MGSYGGWALWGVVQWGGVFLCDPAPFPQMSQSDSGVELSGVQERGWALWGGGPMGWRVRVSSRPLAQMSQSRSSVELSRVLWGAGPMGGWSNGVACPCATPPLFPDEPIREQHGVERVPMGGGPYGRVVQWGGVSVCDPAPFPR